MRYFVYRCLVYLFGLLIVGALFESFQFSGSAAVILAAVILTVANGVIRPLIILLTLPLNIATLGLFILVINGFTLWLTAKLVPGFAIYGFGKAVLGAIVVSLVSILANWFIGKPR